MFAFILNSIICNAQFSEVTPTGLPNITMGAIAFADYDNDGIQDLLLSGDSTNVTISRIYKGNGLGGFTLKCKLKSVKGGNVVWGDIDNDGDLDVIISGINDTNTPNTYLYRNDGSNVFTDISSTNNLPGFFSE
jgi:hypothetical protein